MNPFINIILGCFIFLSSCGQKNHKSESINIIRVDTLCNYVVSRCDSNIILPSSLKLNNNESGTVLLELVVTDSEKVTGWKLYLLRIQQKDSIVRNYTGFSEAEIPNDIEKLKPIFDSIISRIKVKAINNYSFDSKCRIVCAFKLANK